MKISGPNEQPRHERYTYKKRVEVTTGSGDRFETESSDVSVSGMALSLNAPLMDNGQFVELHAEGLGNMSGKVARTYDGGAAVQFEKLLQEPPPDAEKFAKLNKMA